MRRPGFTFLLLLIASCGGTETTGGVGDGDAGGNGANDASGADPCEQLARQEERRVQVAGEGERVYQLVVPEGLSTGQSAAVLNFHGNLSTASEQQLFSQMNDSAAELGFVAVYPQGVGNSWNAGVCCGQAQSENVDELAFARAIIDDLVDSACVERSRVYATGLSNGGFLAHRIACEEPELFAAYSSVAGLVGVPSCNPASRRPILQFHGDADTVVPYEGSPGLGFPPVEDTMDAWAERNGCDATRSVSFEQGDVRCERYDGCDPEAPVELCRIIGGGHTWPSGMVPSVLGPTTTDIDANAYMWSFFEAVAQ